MNLNHKQQELVDFLFNKVKEKFPNVELCNLTTSPDDPEHIWINVITDNGEDEVYSIMDYAVGYIADIHIDYGYRISVMPSNREWADTYLRRAG
jgi:hypothetical protein